MQAQPRQGLAKSAAPSKGESVLYQNYSAYTLEVRELRGNVLLIEAFKQPNEKRTVV
jgi:hypothetical protein